MSGVLTAGRMVDVLTRRRVILLVLLAAAVGTVDGMEPLTPADSTYINAAGMRVLGGDIGAAYEHPNVQVGPLQLLLAGALARFAMAAGVPVGALFSAVIQVMTTVGLVLTLRAFLRAQGRTEPVLELAAGLAVIVAGISWLTYISGHSEETFIGLLWVAAAVEARRERGLAAGVILGLSAGLKLWGLLGLPLLLLAGRTRQRLLGLLSQAAVLVLLYAPFVLSGPVQTFEYRWRVESTLVGFFIDEAEGFGWEMRLAQGAVVVLVGAGVFLWRRDAWGLEWSLPAALVTARMLTDPLPHHYLWLPFEAIALIAIAALVKRARRWVWVLCVVAFYFTTLGEYLPAAAETGLRAGFALALLFAGGHAAGQVRSNTIPEGASS